jgi:hydroxymethylpyrimidine/phosphomethylpyrimidine kinase
MRTALSIAGTDPTGGAGLLADVAVFRALGVHALGVPAALTVQNTQGVKEVLPLEPSFLRRQLQTLLQDLRPHALKTGLLYSTQAVQVVAEALKGHGLQNLVVDPVSLSSTGVPLIEEGALDVLREELLPLARVVTPNIYEAGLLTGLSMETQEELREAAARLRQMGPQVVIITGSHEAESITDLYYDGAFFALQGPFLESSAGLHGTGCVFSAAVAALLALGHSPLEAARRAKDFTHQAIRRAHHPGRGMGLLGL